MVDQLDPLPITSLNGRLIRVTLGDASLEAFLLPGDSGVKISEIWLPPSDRGKGIGKRLVQTFVKWLKGKNINYIIGYDASEFGQSSKIRSTLPGETKFFNVTDDNPDVSGVTLFPDAPKELLPFFEGLEPSNDGKVMVTKLAKQLGLKLGNDSSPTYVVDRDGRILLDGCGVDIGDNMPGVLAQGMVVVIPSESVIHVERVEQLSEMKIQPCLADLPLTQEMQIVCKGKVAVRKLVIDFFPAQSEE